MTEKDAQVEEIFPPLSTTLEHFIVNGSDREFRKTIYGMLTVSSLMLKSRELFGAYIGVSAPQYSMLVAIAESRETTVSDLATALNTSGPFITAEIKKLIRAGYVSKRTNENDRRSSLLSLTELGKTRVRQVAPMRTKANDMIFGSLNPAEAAMFQHLIRVMIRDFERSIHYLEGPEWREPIVRAAKEPRKVKPVEND